MNGWPSNEWRKSVWQMSPTLLLHSLLYLRFKQILMDLHYWTHCKSSILQLFFLLSTVHNKCWTSCCLLAGKEKEVLSKMIDEQMIHPWSIHGQNPIMFVFWFVRFYCISSCRDFCFNVIFVKTEHFWPI